MNDPFLIALGWVASLVIGLASTPFVMRWSRSRGLTGRDRYKPGHPEVPEMGGIAIVLALSGGSFLAAWLTDSLQRLWPVMVTILGLGLAGALHDYYDIKGRQKVVLCALLGLPAVLAVQDTAISIPLLGTIELGVAYYLLVPLAVSAGANGSNILAGYNGMEAGVTAVASLPLLAFSFHRANAEAAILSSCLLAACMAFLYYNHYPSRVFPGDVGTLAMGGALVLSAMLAKAELLGFIIMVPHFGELLCKVSTRFASKEVIGHTQVSDEGLLVPPTYPAVVHAVMRRFPSTEKGLVLKMYILESLFAAAGLGIALASS